MKSQVLLLFVFFILITLPVQAQYQPTAIEGANWVIFYDVKSGADTYTDHHIIRIAGDTIINDLTYKKVYKRKIEGEAVSFQDFVPPFVVSTNTLVGFIRDDIPEERVYIIPENNNALCQAQEEGLLYDFSLEEGDNLSGCLLDPFFAIDSIGQEMIWGQERQTFGVDNDTYKFIEGIGGNEGLFSSTDIFILGVFVQMTYYCIEGNDNCGQLLVNTLKDKIADQEKAEIFPNPTRNKITIKLPDNYAHLDCYVQIFNGVGQLQLSRSLTEKTNLLDIPSLPAGTYFYKILTKTDLLDLGTIIKI